MHKARGFLETSTGIHCGYHEIIRRDGTIELGRALANIGAHAFGFNYTSVGICMIGGLDEDGKSENNFTSSQFDSLIATLMHKTLIYPDAEIVGHRDLSPDADGNGVVTSKEWMKDCPCFDVKQWLALSGVLA
jgi:N-acetyl-anhydromuramyl-L-alanine amidase AmpD